MSDFTVTLDGFAFQGFEVPEALPFGVGHALAIKRLIGGERIVDAMGAEPDPIEWSGRFRGKDAQSRARQLIAKAEAGKQVKLTWGTFAFYVVIEHFRPVLEKQFEIPYTISCVVVSTATGPATSTSADQVVKADNTKAKALGAKIGDGKLSGLLGGLDKAISSVSDIGKAATATINSVLQPIRDVQSRVQTLIGSAEATLREVTTVGGVFPFNPLAKAATKLSDQVNATVRLGNLYDLQSTVGRMAGNLGAIGAGGAEAVVAGGNLFSEAAKHYGDASEWSTIAKANGITDPVISGLKKLLIPPVAKGSGGLLGG